MAEDSWPSPNHNSRAVSDAEYDKLVPNYVANGVLGAPGDTSVVFGDSSARVAQIRSGKFALVRGRLWSSGASTVSKTISANSSGSTRIDLVVLRFNKTTFDVRVAVITGSPGAGAPLPVNDASSFDVALASVKVVNGASVINGADVTPVAFYIGPPPIICTSTTRPPRVPGLQIFETDTGKVLVANASAWATVFEDSGDVAPTVGAGWTFQLSPVVRRRSGIVYASIAVQRTGGALTAGTDTTIATLPAGFRPTHTIQFIGHASNGVLVAGIVTTAGLVTLGTYATTISAGMAVSVVDLAYVGA